MRGRNLLTVGNDRHVTDVVGVVHETTDLGFLLASVSGSGESSARLHSSFCIVVRTSSTVKLLGRIVVSHDSYL